MTELCSFSYTAWTLSFVYLILFFLVIRYLANLIKQNSVKKRAQKLFLCMLIGQTVLRIIYFALFPFHSDSCEPTLKGNDGEEMTGAQWWIHLLSNVPAVLFLMAFSVLVYTFARIYHKVLLAGVWFQERRFRILTGVLILLNTVALVATFGDWAYAAANPSSHLKSFVDMLLYCVLAVSFILAVLFLAYGTLLYYQVQAIIRASSENVGSSHSSLAHTSVTHAREQYGIGAGSYAPSSMSNGGVGLFSKSTSSSIGIGSGNATGGGLNSIADSDGLNLPSDAGTGFTPVQKKRRGRIGGGLDGEEANLLEEEEGSSYNPPPSHLQASLGINRAGGASGVGVVAAVSGASDSSSVYPLSGFASPNLPIPLSLPHGGGVIAHSYVSAEGSFSPEHATITQFQSNAAGVDDENSNSEGQLNPSSATEKTKHEPLQLALQSTAAGNGGMRYAASSVSPEYGMVVGRSSNANPSTTTPSGIVNVPTSGIRHTHTPTIGGVTPTDVLVVGSLPYTPPTPSMTHTQHTPKRASGLSRPGQGGLAYPTTPNANNGVAISGMTPLTNGVASSTHRTFHSPPEDGDSHLLDSDLDHGRDRAKASHGLTNAILHVGAGYFPSEGAHAYPGGGGKAVSRSEYSAAGQRAPAPTTIFEETTIAAHSRPLLSNAQQQQSSSSTSSSSSSHQPPNPMRKIAVIAAICTMCLLVRTILLICIASLGQDFNWLTTLIYFLFSEILPLLAMLKVFNTPTPLVHVLGGSGAGGSGGGTGF